MSTPFGRRGWFFKEWTEGQDWQRVLVPADQCARISPAFLEEERRSLPPLWYRSEYCCEFCDVEDQLLFYRGLAAIAQSEQRLDIRDLPDSVNA